MNKKPYLLRSFFALVVVLVFVASMFPLHQSNFYKTFKKLLVNPDAPEIQKVVSDAEKMQLATPGLPDSTALETAASENQVNLVEFVRPVVVKTQKLKTNGDVISVTRKNASGSIRLGIDLNGGVEFILKLTPADEKESDRISKNFERYRDMAIETLRKRLESIKLFETEISPAGKEYISLRAPLAGKSEKDKIARIISMTARLQFKLCHPDTQHEVAKYLQNPEAYVAPEGCVIMKCDELDKNGKLESRYFLVERETQLDGREVEDSHVQTDSYGFRQIAMSFKTSGAVKFGDITRNNPGRLLAIILDGKLYSAPSIREPITGGNAVITGAFSKEDAENISNALVSGSMPFKITIASQSDIDPSVGTETIRSSLFSGILGTVLVMLFMLIYYRLSGIVANISLVVNALLILGALAAFDVTLTLPGIAGIVLTIGMAVDANVLIYERIREEIEAGKSVANAVDMGFGRAFSAIFDSNLTTLFVALILMWQGTGAIKGFAITLAIGIFTTMFTAVFLTRLLFDIMLRLPFNITNLKMMSFMRHPHIDFLGQRWIAVTISGALILFSLAYIGYENKNLLGVDFTGGTQLEMSFAKYVPMPEIDQYLKNNKFEARTTYKSTSAGEQKVLEMIVRPQKGATSLNHGEALLKEMTDGLNKKFPAAQFKPLKQDTVGALIGAEFTKSALIAMGLAVLGMIVYMMIRFELSYSIAANLALLHDVIIAVGIYTFCGGQITMQAIAGVLTLIGYSVNDTIVTFDRQRENLRLIQGDSYWNLINLSINQTLGRTLLTSLSVLLILLTQFFFGGSGIRDFVSIMLIGCIVGTYSSIYTASIIVAYWHKPVKSVSEESSKPAGEVPAKA